MRPGTSRFPNIMEEQSLEPRRSDSQPPASLGSLLLSFASKKGYFQKSLFQIIGYEGIFCQTMSAIWWEGESLSNPPFWRLRPKKKVIFWSPMSSQKEELKKFFGRRYFQDKVFSGGPLFFSILRSCLLWYFF